MRTVQLTRISKYMSAMIAYSVIIDGQQVGLLTNGKRFAFVIDERPHTMTVGDMIMYKRFSATITIPAGGADIAFHINTKFSGKVEIEPVYTPAAPVAPAAPTMPAPTPQTPVYRAPQGPVNELIPYRPGGAAYLRPSVEEIHRMGIRELESYMIGNTLGTLLSSGCIDVHGQYVQSVAHESGTAILSSKARFTVMEGSCSYSTTFYVDAAFRQEIIMNPYVQTFDWLLSTPEEERQCKALSHDLDMIRRVALTVIAMECPNAWMVQNVLYSQQP